MLFHHALVIPGQTCLHFYKHVLPVLQRVVKPLSYLLPADLFYLLPQLLCQAQLWVLLVLQKEGAQPCCLGWQHSDATHDIWQSLPPPLIGGGAHTLAQGSLDRGYHALCHPIGVRILCGYSADRNAHTFAVTYNLPFELATPVYTYTSWYPISTYYLFMYKLRNMVRV